MRELPKKLTQEGRALLDLIPGGVMQCLYDERFTIIDANEGFYQMFGFSRAELSERFHNSLSLMIHPDDRDGNFTEISSQLSNGAGLSLNTRIICKDGSYKWVASSAKLLKEQDEKCFLTVMLDLTEVKNAQEKLRLSLERLEIIASQFSDIIFDWDLKTGQITYSSNCQEKIGYPHQTGEAIKKEQIFGRIHPDDAENINVLKSKIRRGESPSSVDARIENTEGRYIWCRIKPSLQYDQDGTPLRSVGTISDINEEMQLVESLRKQAELDTLTGLYNHAETERRASLYLKSRPDVSCALYIIDVDNFKNVNDGQGHLFGDTVLAELAAGMKKLARQGDVIGRIGGDEFAVFLKDIGSAETAKAKAKQFLEAFGALFQGEKSEIGVTCSIGVALYPEDGEDYYSLYHSADLALYYAKKQGKNQYARFDRALMDAMKYIGPSSLGAAIDSDQKTGENETGSLLSYVFQILYESKDIDGAVQEILEIVGRRFDVSRAYVFENSENGEFTNNTYEWCNDSIVPQKEFLQHYPYENVSGYQDLFRDDAIFYCRDIHSLTPAQAALFESQGIRSTLQCALYDENKFRGFIGFDECTGLRMWNQTEIDMLSLVAQILTTFLLKKREVDRNQKMIVQLNAILDTQDAYIYAITQGTYELLYLNQKTLSPDPNAALGMTCHQAFFGRSAPCVSCPLTGATEVYNPQYDVWTKIKFAEMKWGGSNAYLISCFDISEYKRSASRH